MQQFYYIVFIKICANVYTDHLKAKEFIIRNIASTGIAIFFFTSTVMEITSEPTIST